MEEVPTFATKYDGDAHTNCNIMVFFNTQKGAFPGLMTEDAIKVWDWPNASNYCLSGYQPDL